MKPFFRRDTHKGEGVPLTKHQTCWTSRDSRVFSSHANIFRTKRIQTGGDSSVSRSIGPSVANLVSINKSRRRKKKPDTDDEICRHPSYVSCLPSPSNHPPSVRKSRKIPSTVFNIEFKLRKNLIWSPYASHVTPSYAILLMENLSINIRVNVNNEALPTGIRVRGRKIPLQICK